MFETLRDDPAEIHRFVTEQNARTETALKDAAFEAAAQAAAQILASEAHLPGLSRRGAWLYTFRKTAAQPRGVWQRRREDGVVEAQSGWETVFDLDAYCAAEGSDWHWAGAPTCPEDPDRVLIALSQGGSDQKRYQEYDCAARAFVEGGFSFGPERGHVAWLDRDTVLWSSALQGDATNSSWPGVVRRVARGQEPQAGEELYRAAPTDLLASGYAIRARDGGRIPCTTRIPNIGEQEITLLTASGPVTLPTPSDTTAVHSDTHYAFVVKGKGGPVGALMLGAIGGAPARVIVDPGPRQAIGMVDILQDWLIWGLRDAALRPRFFALALDAPEAEAVEIRLPEPADAAYLYGHSAVDNGDETLQLNLQGFLTPPRSYTFDLSKGPEAIAWRPLWSEPAEFNADGHEVRLLEATSDDGTKVPYHLVVPRDAPADVPVLLYGYGGFNVSMLPHYAALTGRLWLQPGGAFVQAHIRGGGEFGPDWHKAAKQQNRHKAFEDFAAIAQDLVARGITTAGRIACNGGSNGGLLTGVMLTRYPERFGAVWTNVGVHDMLGFHEFPAGRAWIDEYGDPDDAEDAAYLRSYSPLHNVVEADRRAYPPCLVETADFDDRVDPSHSRRFAARLAEAGQDMLYAEHKGGHGGSSSAIDRARNIALGYSFLRHALGIGR